MQHTKLNPLPVSRLSICTFSAGLARRPDLFQRTGIGVEISDFAYARNLDEEPRSAIRSDLHALRPYLQGPLGFHAPYRSMDPASPDPAIRAVTAERYRAVISLAREFSADYIVLHANYNPQWATAKNDQYFLDACAEFYAPLIEAAGPTSLLLENMFEDKPERLLPLLEKMAGGLGLLLDSGHLNVYSQVPPVTWVDVCRPWLRALHLNDNTGQMDRHEALGKGTFPLQEFLEAALPQKPLLCVEVKNFEEVKASVAKLVELGAVEAVALEE